MYNILITYIKPLDDPRSFQFVQESFFKVNMDEIDTLLAHPVYPIYKVSILLSKLPI